MKIPFNLRVVYTLLTAILIFAGTIVAIQYARGIFRFTRQGVVANTGLLSANSFPPGAEVYIDDRLVTATDDTLYLEPGNYTVKIIKDGYSPWQKELQVEKELVTQTNAELFRLAPGLTPLTFTGVDNVTPSPDGQKLLYYTASASSELKKGLYVLELTDSFLSLQRGPRQLVQDIPTIDLKNAEYIWSPDSTEVMVISTDKEALITIDKKQDLSTLPDISFQRKRILSEWEEEMYVRERQFLREFPPQIIEVATSSARNVYISPDKKRVLYVATSSATIPEDIVPPVPARNNQPEDRTLDPGTVYIYDREEDKNFAIGQIDKSAPLNKILLASDLYTRQAASLLASPSAFTQLQATSSAQTAFNYNLYHTPLFAESFQWFPDSKHVIWTNNTTISIKEYDGANETTLFSGPFLNNFVYPWPDGGKVVILASFSPDTPPNLYAINLK